VAWILVFLLLLTVAVLYAWTLLGFFFYEVPYVPTSRKVIRKMIELADIKSSAVVYDLGCGDGRILLSISTPNVQRVGYDRLPFLIWWARLKSKLLCRKAEFHCGDFFTADLSNADDIFCYLWPSVMDRIYTEKYPTLKMGCRIISHGFEMSDLRPAQKVQVGRAKIWVYEKKGGSKS